MKESVSMPQISIVHAKFSELTDQQLSDIEAILMDADDFGARPLHTRHGKTCANQGQPLLRTCLGHDCYWEKVSLGDVLIAYYQGSPAGILTFHPVTAEQLAEFYCLNPDDIDLHIVAVAQTWRGRGVARRLYKWLVHYCDQLGVNCLVETWTGNLPQMALIPSHGFQEIKRWPARYNIGSENVISFRPADGS